MGRFGLSVATTLFEMGGEVPAIDKDRDLINDVQDRVTHAVALNATKVVSPEVDMGSRLAKRLITGSIVDFLELPRDLL